MSHLAVSVQHLMEELKSQMSRATFANNIGDLLLSQLECPICMTTSLPPIYTCTNGHNVCSTCQPKIAECPVCRVAGRPDKRNLFAEEVSVNAWQDCRNLKQGCPQSLKIKVMKVHLEFCDYGYKCMFESCSWRGSVVDLEDHVKEVHSDFYFECSLGGVTILNDYRGKLAGSEDEFSDYKDDEGSIDENYYSIRLSTAMIAYKNKIFWYHAEHDDVDSLKVQIRQINALDCDKKFAYRLRFESADRTRTLVYRNKVKTLTDGRYCDVVFNDPLEMTPYFEGGLLTFRLELHEDKDDGKEKSKFEDPGDGFPEVRLGAEDNDWQLLGYKDLGEE